MSIEQPGKKLPNYSQSGTTGTPSGIGIKPFSQWRTDRAMAGMQRTPVQPVAPGSQIAAQHISRPQPEGWQQVRPSATAPVASATVPTPPVATPKVEDPDDGIPTPEPAQYKPYTQQSGDTADRWAAILGKSPEERAADDEKARKRSLSMQTLGYFFDGLRHLGAVAGGGYYVPLSDSGAQIKAIYDEKAAQQRQRDMESAQYKLNLYRLKKEEADEAKANAKEAEARERQARMDRYKEEEQKREREKHEGWMTINGLTARNKELKNTNQETKNKNLQAGRTEQGGVPSQGRAGGSRGSGGRGGRGSGSEDAIWKEYEDFIRQHPDQAPKKGKEPKTAKQAKGFLTTRRGVMNGRRGGSGTGGGGYR